MQRYLVFGLMLLVATTLCKAQNVPSDKRSVLETETHKTIAFDKPELQVDSHSTQDNLAEWWIDDFIQQAKADWESFCKNTYVDKEHSRILDDFWTSPASSPKAYAMLSVLYNVCDGGYAERLSLQCYETFSKYPEKGESFLKFLNSLSRDRAKPATNAKFNFFSDLVVEHLFGFEDSVPDISTVEKTLYDKFPFLEVLGEDECLCQTIGEWTEGAASNPSEYILYAKNTL